MNLSTDLIEKFVANLREIPFIQEASLDVPPSGELGAWEPDVHVVLGTPTGKVRLFGEVKTSHLTHSVANGLLSRVGREAEKWLLLATHVGRPLGKLLRDAGINYMDQSGNCFLRIEDHYIASIEGRRAVRTEGARGMKAAGARILFALLAEPGLLHATYREIGDQAGASHKAARDAIARLARVGEVMVQRRKREWLPGGRRSAFERWLGDYDSILRPSLDFGRFRTQEQGPEQLDAKLAEFVARGSCQFGGLSAGYRLVEHYRGQGTLVHIRGQIKEFTRELRALRDPQGQLTVLRLPCEIAARGALPGTVHPLLVYAEMLHSRDERAREAAALVRTHYLREYA